MSPVILQLRRREFIALLGGAAAWQLAARGQQPAVVGFLSSLSQAQTVHLVASFRRGAHEVGFVEGQNMAIEYRFADGAYDRLPVMVRTIALPRAHLYRTRDRSSLHRREPIEALSTILIARSMASSRCSMASMRTTGVIGL
jgi:hypothetical protein